MTNSKEKHCRWAGAQLGLISPAGSVRFRHLQLCILTTRQQRIVAYSAAANTINEHHLRISVCTGSTRSETNLSAENFQGPHAAKRATLEIVFQLKNNAAYEPLKSEMKGPMSKKSTAPLRSTSALSENPPSESSVTNGPISRKSTSPLQSTSPNGN